MGMVGVGASILTAALNAPRGGSSPPPGYTTGGVAVDGESWLGNDVGVAPDTPLISWARWAYFTSFDTVPIGFVADPASYISYDQIGGSGKYEVTLENGDESAGLFSSNGPPVIPLNEWICLLGCGDTNHPAGSKILKCFLGDTDVTATITDVNDAFDMAFASIPFYFGGSASGNAFVGYVSDTWIAPGQFIDFSIEANRRKFISADGKPVDLGSDGSTPTGTAPPIFLHVDADGDPADFATNRGTGGDFAVGGGVTQTGALVSGSADVVMADVTGIIAGAFVHVTGVPAGTTVLSIDTLTVTMSAQATATNPTASIQFGGVLMLAPSSPSD